MEKYLKEEIEYNDLYDRQTVETCREIEQCKLGVVVKGEDSELKEVKEKWLNVVKDVVNAVRIEKYCANRYNDKSQTITEWIGRDRERDEMLENAVMPRGFSCLTCGSGMIFEMKTLVTHREPEQVLFFFRCENKDCKKGRAFYDNGKEFIVRPDLCPKCKHELAHTSTHKDKVVTTIYNCNNCGHNYEDTFTFSSEDKPDPNYEKDRLRFCWDEKTYLGHIQSMGSLERVADWMKENREKERNKELYDEVAKLKKLPIGEVQRLLAEAFEKEHYVNLQFLSPEMGKDLIVGFNAVDGKSNRDEYASKDTLKKLIAKILEGSNWKLMMTDGISYRMGYLSGRIRGLEREEDLLDLVRRNVEKRNH